MKYVSFENPQILRGKNGTTCMFLGGYEYDGGTEIGPIKEAEVRATVREDLGKGITSFVISGVFSPVNSTQEARVKQIVQDEFQQASAGHGDF